MLFKVRKNLKIHLKSSKKFILRKYTPFMKFYFSFTGSWKFSKNRWPKWPFCQIWFQTGLKGRENVNWCPFLSSEPTSFSFQTVLISLIHFSLKRHLQIRELENMLQKPNTFFFALSKIIFMIGQFWTNQNLI